MSNFVHLHNHSEYSLLDGFSRLPEMVERAASFDQPALALTDHGNMHGAVDFFKLAKKAGIKPIIGVEGYITKGSRREKLRDEQIPPHITLLAQNEKGYRNLLKLVTVSHLEGFYYRPRMDKEILESYSEGIIALSGCPSAELWQSLAKDKEAEALEAIGWYKEVFGSRYYIELMRHKGIPNQDKVNAALVEIAKRTETPMVITNDSHYVRREEAKLQDILTCIQTNAHVNLPNRLRFEDDTYHICSYEEMLSRWEDLPEALHNSLDIADSISFGMDFSRTLFPRFQATDGLSAMEYLRKLCEEGMHRRYGNPSEIIRERLEYELNVVDTTQFADYFLVCWDIFNFVNRQEILSTVRGSAASSLILYCLNVTQVDPMEFSLVFERFLNVERKELPDIDMDFQDDRRGEVIQYCVKKYGAEHVAQIITFGTLGAKAALRDVTRALNADAATGDRLARQVPERLGVTLKDAIRESSEMRQIMESSPDAKRIVDMAIQLEGSVRHASTHAAGVVICDEPLTNHAPLQRPNSKEEGAPPTIQYSMNPAAEIGLLKMDFLGLRNLTVLDRTLKMISREGKMKISDIPLDNTATFNLLSKGDTYGVFQLESEGMRHYIKDLKPTSVMDVAAMIALYRPGPMEHIGEFIEAKHNRRAVSYLHPNLQPILEETYGVIVYQDQILLIAREFGGYTLGNADILRKAMGKKIPEVMAAERENFVTGAENKNYTRALAEKIFDLIEPFAGYAFNKAHSVSYAIIAYWTAYLKANYPTEYFAALMESFRSDQNKLTHSIWQARRAGTTILGPDMNDSNAEFTIGYTGNGKPVIRFGLAAIKGVGESTIQPVLEERRNGTFESIEDFCKRVGVDDAQLSRRVIENLIKSGAMDCFGSRGILINALDRIASHLQRKGNPHGENQSSLFNMEGFESSDMERIIPLGTSDDVSLQEKISWERDLLGLEVTDNPYLRALSANQKEFVVSSEDITSAKHGRRIRLIGAVNNVRRRNTKKGDTFLEVDMGLTDGLVKVMVWPETLEKTRSLWEKGRYLILDGRINERAEEVSVEAFEAEKFSLEEDAARLQMEGANPPPKEVTEGMSAAPASSSGSGAGVGLLVRIEETSSFPADRAKVEEFMRILVEHEGNEEVMVELFIENRTFKMRLPFFPVSVSDELTEELTKVFGAANVQPLLIL